MADASARDSLTATALGTISSPVAEAMTRVGQPMVRFRLGVAGRSALTTVAIACFGPLVTQARGLQEGQRLRVTGRLELRRWLGADGTARHGISIIADTIEALDPLFAADA